MIWKDQERLRVKDCRLRSPTKSKLCKSSIALRPYSDSRESTQEWKEFGAVCSGKSCGASFFPPGACSMEIWSSHCRCDRPGAEELDPTAPMSARATATVGEVLSAVAKAVPH